MSAVIDCAALVLLQGASQPSSRPAARPRVELREVASFRVLGGAVQSVAWSPDGQRLASLGTAGDLLLWTADPRETHGWRVEKVLDVRGHPRDQVLSSTDTGKQILALASDRTGQTLVALTQDSFLVLAPDTLAVRKELTVSEQTSAPVFLDDTLAVSHDPDGLTFWRVPMFVPLERVPWPGAMSLAASSDGRLLAVADALQVRVVEVRR